MHKNNSMGNTIQQSKKAMSSNDDRFKCVMWPVHVNGQNDSDNKDSSHLTQRICLNCGHKIGNSWRNLSLRTVLNSCKCAVNVALFFVRTGLKRNSLIFFIVVEMRIKGVKWKSSPHAHSFCSFVCNNKRGSSVQPTKRMNAGTNKHLRPVVIIYGHFTGSRSLNNLFHSLTIAYVLKSLFWWLWWCVRMLRVPVSMCSVCEKKTAKKHL